MSWMGMPNIHEMSTKSSHKCPGREWSQEDVFRKGTAFSRAVKPSSILGLNPCDEHAPSPNQL